MGIPRSNNQALVTLIKLVLMRLSLSMIMQIILYSEESHNSEVEEYHLSKILFGMI